MSKNVIVIYCFLGDFLLEVGPQYNSLKPQVQPKVSNRIAIIVKVLSRIQKNTPYRDSWGFIGLAFRINSDNSAFESMYIRPEVGQVRNPVVRNQAIQYYSYPNYKMDNIGRSPGGPFEASADIGLDEWITLRIEVDGQQAPLNINDQKEPSLSIKQLKGNLKSRAVGLWVDVGTEGCFKDLRITKK